MKSVWTVARRELRGYFDYPTAYILAIAFIALGLFLTFRAIYAQHVGTLRPFFDLLPWLLAIFAPAITMRSLAEERRTHTLEWLMAQPLGEREVVLGKFLGDWMFLLITLACSLPAAIGIVVLAKADPGIMLAQYVGGALLSAQAVAVGLWASSVTRNQITAFVLAVTVSLVLMLIGLQVVTIGLTPFLAGIVIRLAVLPHFESVARGVVDLRDLLYFVTVAGLFLVFAGTALARERLSHARGAYRRLRQGALVAAAGVIVLNLLGGYLHGRLDFTRNGLYTLSPSARTLVKGLKDIVQVKLYVSDELPPEVQGILRDARDLLADMRRASDGNLRVIEANPDGNPAVEQEARMLGINTTDFSVMRDNEFQVKRGWLGLAVTYANGHRVIPVIDRSDDLEFRLATFISALTTPRRPKVAFLAAAGTRGIRQFLGLAQSIEERYEVTTIDTTQLAQLIPDSIKVLVVASPLHPIDPATLQRVESYLSGGGSLLVLVENLQVADQSPEPVPTRSGLGPFLEAHGVGLRPGVVYDMRSHAAVRTGAGAGGPVARAYPLWPVATRAADHATTRNLTGLLLSWPMSLVVRDPVHVTPLWNTSNASGLRSEMLPIAPDQFSPGPVDSMAPQTIAVAVDPGVSSTALGANAARPAGRMIVVGDADFMGDQLSPSNQQNLIFAANALDWLGQDEMLIRIRSKQRMPPQLTFGSTFASGLFKWGNLVGVPLILALVGMIRITGRARRARARWSGSNSAAPVASTKATEKRK